MDLAAEQGGNCAVTEPGGRVSFGGVTVIGPLNLPSAHALHASQLYSRNVASFLQHLIQEGRLQLDLADELARGPLLTHEGQVVHEATRARIEAGSAA